MIKSDTMEGRATFVSLFTILMLAINSTKADYFVQTEDCSEDLKLTQYYMKTNNEERIMSKAKGSNDYYYYKLNCDNALTLIGKNDYQFDVEILLIDLPQPTDQGICMDYLKIYDAARVDNAMLMTPLEGLCGSSLPVKRVYKTSKNYLTVRFKTGRTKYNSNHEGFVLKIIQNPWSNPGNSKIVGFNPGGWNDGLSSSFQWTWNLQVRVPGALRRPGVDLEKSPNGIDCVECSSCSVHDFDLDRDAYATSKGCFMCAKIWNSDYAAGHRTCFSERGYMSLLMSFGDPRIDLTTREGLFQQIGCHQYYDQYGTRLNYCFCNENKCNAATHVTQSLPVLALLLCICILRLLF